MGIPFAEAKVGPAVSTTGVEYVAYVAWYAERDEYCWGLCCMSGEVM